MTSIQQDIDQLERLVGKNGVQETRHLGQLQDLVTVRLGIDPAKATNNLPDMLAVSLTAEGKKTMDNIDRVLFQMREQEESQLNARWNSAPRTMPFPARWPPLSRLGHRGRGPHLHHFHPRAASKNSSSSSPSAPGTGQVKDGNDWILAGRNICTQRFGLSVSPRRFPRSRAQDDARNGSPRKCHPRARPRPRLEATIRKPLERSAEIM